DPGPVRGGLGRPAVVEPGPVRPPDHLLGGGAPDAAGRLVAPRPDRAGGAPPDPLPDQRALRAVPPVLDEARVRPAGGAAEGGQRLHTLPDGPRCLMGVLAHHPRPRPR